MHAFDHRTKESNTQFTTANAYQFRFVYTPNGPGFFRSKCILFSSVLATQSKDSNDSRRTTTKQICVQLYIGILMKVSSSQWKHIDLLLKTHINIRLIVRSNKKNNRAASEKASTIDQKFEQSQLTSTWIIFRSKFQTLATPSPPCTLTLVICYALHIILNDAHPNKIERNRFKQGAKKQLNSQINLIFQQFKMTTKAGAPHYLLTKKHTFYSMSIGIYFP